jgi:hypothetical protein
MLGGNAREPTTGKSVYVALCREPKVSIVKNAERVNGVDGILAGERADHLVEHGHRYKWILRRSVDNLSAARRMPVHSACVAYDRHPPETLPVRGQGRSTLPGGRHRRPASADLPPDAPALVLAVPTASTAAGGPRPEGWTDRTATEIASLTRAALADIDIRVGRVPGTGGDGTALLSAPEARGTRWTEGRGTSDEGSVYPKRAEAARGTLIEILHDIARTKTDSANNTNNTENVNSARAGGAGPTAVVVPLLTGPNEEAYEHIRAAVAAGGTTAVITEPLGPHPLLAEALHVRLAESGLARADRIRQFSIGATVDGVVVATMGGAAAVQEAEITAVLLAARLAVPVIAASLDGRPSVADAAARLREAGAARLALAPHLIGPEGDHELVTAAAAQVDAGCAAPLGAHEGIVRLVNLRYEVALEEHAVGAPGAVGSRKETS